MVPTSTAIAEVGCVYARLVSLAIHAQRIFALLLVADHMDIVLLVSWEVVYQYKLTLLVFVMLLGRDQRVRVILARDKRVVGMGIVLLSVRRRRIANAFLDLLVPHATPHATDSVQAMAESTPTTAAKLNPLLPSATMVELVCTVPVYGEKQIGVVLLTAAFATAWSVFPPIMNVYSQVFA